MNNCCFLKSDIYPHKSPAGLEPLVLHLTSMLLEFKIINRTEKSNLYSRGGRKWVTYPSAILVPNLFTTYIHWLLLSFLLWSKISAFTTLIIPLSAPAIFSSWLSITLYVFPSLLPPVFSPPSPQAPIPPTHVLYSCSSSCSIPTCT